MFKLTYGLCQPHSNDFKSPDTHDCFAQCLTPTASRGWDAVVLVTVTVTSDEEQTIPITGKRHTCHPNTSLPTTGVLVLSIGLGNQWSCFRYKLCDDVLRGDIDSHYHSCVVEEIAVAAESTVHNITPLEQRLD